MKKICSFILAGVLLFSLVACGNTKVADSGVTAETLFGDAQEIELTLENVYDYFEYYEYTYVYHDLMGDPSTMGKKCYLKLKDEYADCIDPYESSIVIETHVEYCSYKLETDYKNAVFNLGERIGGDEHGRDEQSQGGYLHPDDQKDDPLFFGVRIALFNEGGDVAIDKAESEGYTISGLDTYEILRVKGTLVRK